MKPDFRVDYRSKTAAHYTTYSMTEASRKIVARNNNRLQSIAENAKNTISNQAAQKLKNSFLGTNLDIVV